MCLLMYWLSVILVRMLGPSHSTFNYETEVVIHYCVTSRSEINGTASAITAIE